MNLLKVNPKFKVLIIDDDPNIHKIIENVNMDFHFHLYCAYSAQEGMVLARRHKPHLILLDIFLPGGDGRDLIGYFNKQNNGATICMLTSSCYKEDVDHCIKWGVENYIVKPINLKKLQDVLYNRFETLEESFYEDLSIDLEFDESDSLPVADIQGSMSELNSEIISFSLESLLNTHQKGMVVNFSHLKWENRLGLKKLLADFKTFKENGHIFSLSIQNRQLYRKIAKLKMNHQLRFYQNIKQAMVSCRIYQDGIKI